jgi:hypothetical protein
MTDPIVIYGRNAELERLRDLFSRRHSFLVHGPIGVGKTLLLKHLAGEGNEILYCEESSSSHTVFRTLANELFARRDPAVLAACGQVGTDKFKQKSAVSLRGIVTSALRDKKYCLVLDHIAPPSQSGAATLRQLLSETGAVAAVAARSAHMEDVGFLLPLFFDQSAKYALRNFDNETARAFAVRTAAAIQFSAINHDEVIDKVVALSKGNPGAILAMLRMAASPKYIAHQHVKLSPLYIDFRLSWGA